MGPSSSWSLIVRAQGSGPLAERALGELIRRYETSVMTLFRQRKHPPDQTPEDLKQEFFARVLKRNDIARLSEARGHFRGWLRVAVQHFLINDWHRWYGVANGNSVTDLLATEGGHGETPEHLYLRAFSWDTYLHVLGSLREERSQDPAQARQSIPFEALLPFLPGPQIDLEGQGVAAQALGITANTFTVAVWRLRELLKERLRIAVAETLDVDSEDPAAQGEIDREMAQIYRHLCEKPQA